MGFTRQEYWSGLPFPSSKDLPNPGIETESLMTPASAGRWVFCLFVCFLLLEPPGKSILQIGICFYEDRKIDDVFKVLIFSKQKGIL